MFKELGKVYSYKYNNKNYDLRVVYAAGYQRYQLVYVQNGMVNALNFSNQVDKTPENDKQALSDASKHIKMLVASLII